VLAVLHERFGDRIAVEETLEGAMARVFGGPLPQAGTEVAPSQPVGASYLPGLEFGLGLRFPRPYSVRSFKSRVGHECYTASMTCWIDL